MLITREGSGTVSVEAIYLVQITLSAPEAPFRAVVCGESTSWLDRDPTPDHVIVCERDVLVALPAVFGAGVGRAFTNSAPVPDRIGKPLRTSFSGPEAEDSWRRPFTHRRRSIARMRSQQIRFCEGQRSTLGNPLGAGDRPRGRGTMPGPLQAVTIAPTTDSERDEAPCAVAIAQVRPNEPADGPARLSWGGHPWSAGRAACKHVSAGGGGARHDSSVRTEPVFDAAYETAVSPAEHLLKTPSRLNDHYRMSSERLFVDTDSVRTAADGSAVNAAEWAEYQRACGQWMEEAEEEILRCQGPVAAPVGAALRNHFDGLNDRAGSASDHHGAFGTKLLAAAKRHDDADSSGAESVRASGGAA